MRILLAMLAVLYCAPAIAQTYSLSDQSPFDGATPPADAQAFGDYIAFGARPVGVMDIWGVALPNKSPAVYRWGPSLIHFERADDPTIACVQVGHLGSPEANLSFNMDYRSGAHTLCDPNQSATWLAIAQAGWGMQYAAANSTPTNDIWFGSGAKVPFYQYTPSGEVALNTNTVDIQAKTHSAQINAPYPVGKPTLGGMGEGVVIDGSTTPNPNSKVWINRHDSGDVVLADGGGRVGVGTDNAKAALDVAGKIRIGNDADTPEFGAIRYRQVGCFEGYTIDDGSGAAGWVSLGPPCN